MTEEQVKKGERRGEMIWETELIELRGTMQNTRYILGNESTDWELLEIQN